MTDPVQNIHEYTVSELSALLKRTVEESFSYVRVRAEISGFKRAASGHLYMSLKDDKAVIDGVCWRGNAGRLGFNPEDGLEVVCSGKLTTYPARSKYQLVIEHMEPAGAGALMALLEERKKKLAAEGLFDEARKKPIPYLPVVIGVITSPTGAVIRDILHRLADRFPRRVILWPVRVQGEGAAEGVAAAIAGFNALAPDGDIPRPDLLIVARGGGSLEDLWAFNEEIVVRAAAASEIPLISAVGHETDSTLIDYASDRRAPTPTAAAEMAVPVRADLKYSLSDLENRMVRGRARLFERLAERISGLARGLPSPRDILGMAQQRLDDLADRLPRGLQTVAHLGSARLERVAGGLSPAVLRQSVALKGEQTGGLANRLHRAFDTGVTATQRKLEALSRILESMSHQRVLERGFALIYGAAGEAITSAAGASPGDDIDITFDDGHMGARVTGGSAEAKMRRKTKARSKPRKQSDSGGKQGQLF